MTQMTNTLFPIYIGWDSREPVAYEVCKHSIERHTSAPIRIHPLKQKELRKARYFCRPGLIQSDTGHTLDLIDNRPYSTEFAFTRFLVPHLCNYQGWALFMDSDMIFTTDIKKLLALKDDKYAVMVVKHNHVPKEATKMDDQPQGSYHRKNWSSFILWNCGHPANAKLSAEVVNTYPGRELHGFAWLKDSEIGTLGSEWNWIEGVSPVVEQIPGKQKTLPSVIHYTTGGPWFPECQDCMYAEEWTQEYERFQEDGNGSFITHIPSTYHD